MLPKTPLCVFLTPFVVKPLPGYIESFEWTIPLLEAAGWRHALIGEQGNAYISGARATLLRKALNLEPTCVVYLDYDLSWKPEHLVNLIETEGDVVAGNYRFKSEPEDYMGVQLTDDDGHTLRRGDGCIQMHGVPAGFLKITTKAVEKFMDAYPELVYGYKWHPHIDLFNHGAIDRVWFGEDFAFSKRWRAMGETIWCQPDLDITHHTATDAYFGNFNDYLCRQPGGSKDPMRNTMEIAA
jgi:hypothetical protein